MMIEDKLLELAEHLARAAHDGQTEESTGDPYVIHVERVVALVSTPHEKAVAWLHDVIEDNVEFTEQYLLDEGVPALVVAAVSLLTRRPPPDSYETYIGRLLPGADDLARAVKIADLRDHLRPNCPERLRPRYERALRRLLDSVNY